MLYHSYKQCPADVDEHRALDPLEHNGGGRLAQDVEPVRTHVSLRLRDRLDQALAIFPEYHLVVGNSLFLLPISGPEGCHRHCMSIPRHERSLQPWGASYNK